MYAWQCFDYRDYPAFLSRSVWSNCFAGTSGQGLHKMEHPINHHMFDWVRNHMCLVLAAMSIDLTNWQIRFHASFQQPRNATESENLYSYSFCFDCNGFLGSTKACERLPQTYWNALRFTSWIFGSCTRSCTHMMPHAYVCKDLLGYSNDSSSLHTSHGSIYCMILVLRLYSISFRDSRCYTHMSIYTYLHIHVFVCT